jgi:hypothetical protein
MKLPIPTTFGRASRRLRDVASLRGSLEHLTSYYARVVEKIDSDHSEPISPSSVTLEVVAMGPAAVTRPQW